MDEASQKVLHELKQAHDAFVEIRCCDELLGLANSLPFTAEAGRVVQEICNRLGAKWTDDPVAKRMLVDPASYAPPDDGSVISFACPKCAGTFMWAGGVPVKVTAA